MITDELRCNHIVVLKLSGGGTSKELLYELADYAVQKGYAKEGYDQALLTREAEFPTGIQAKQGIAIPHADQMYTKKGTIIIAILEQKSEFLEMGSKKPVHVEFVFLLLINDMKNQVKVLERIVSLIQDEQQMELLHTCEAIPTLEKIFKEYV